MPDLKHKMASERAAGLVPFHGTAWVSHDLRDDHSGVMWKVQGDGIVATWRVATVNSKRQRQKKGKEGCDCHTKTQTGGGITLILLITIGSRCSLKSDFNVWPVFVSAAARFPSKSEEK